MQTSFWDTDQSLQLNGSLTPAKSLENEQQKDGSLTCQCGKEMSACLIHPSTPEEWVASMRDSLARILALPENKQGLAKKHVVASTVKSSASLGWFDPVTCSWKTSQQSFLTDLEQYLETWPRSGMTQSGYAYELPIVGRITLEIDGGYLPTPTVSSGAQVAWNKTPGQTVGTTLAGYVRYWPTPLARDSRTVRGGARTANSLGTEPLITQVAEVEGLEDGALNPDWVEWLMGFPIGFSASKDWAVRKSRSKPPLPGNSLGENK